MSANTQDIIETTRTTDGPPDVDLSIIVPCYNEAEGIQQTHHKLLGVLKETALRWQIVYVDDGSTDQTLTQLVRLPDTGGQVMVVELARNFGKELALTAGIDFAEGRAVIPLDADLQDPPELIPALLAEWRKGYEVVVAVRSRRDGDSRGKTLWAKAYYRVFNLLSEIPIPANAGDFRLMDRAVVDILRQLPESSRFMKGLMAWPGFRQTTVYFNRPERSAGTTKWSFWRLLRFGLGGIVSFSSIPLMIWVYVGMVIAFAAFAYAAYLFGRTLMFGVDVPGYASLMVALLFMTGMTLLSTGILGTYVSRIYTEVKRRPLYVVRRVHGPTSDKLSTIDDAVHSHGDVGR